MTPHSHDRLRAVGRQMLATRKRLGMSRVELAHMAGLSDKSVARLENGDEVRLSTYLAVVDCFKVRGAGVVGLADRIATLPDHERVRAIEFVEQLERNQRI